MRKILCSMIVSMGLATPLLAQWERWQPWVKEVGVTPYTEVNFKVAPSCSLGAYELKKTGLDFIIGVQVVIPPLYMRYGFSNIYNLFIERRDTIFCPLFADWRLGAQITYEDITTYDLSLSFIKSFAVEDFMSILLEIGYGRIVGKLAVGEIQILGNLGIGSNTQNVRWKVRGVEYIEKSSQGVFNLSLGVFWRTLILSPYLHGGISYPFTAGAFELHTFVGVGLQVYFPHSYVKPLPDIVYPKLFFGPPKRGY